MLKLARGNPGAMRVIAELLSKENGLLEVSKFDDLQIYESLIWLCYKDLLGCDIDKLYNLLRTNKLATTIEKALQTNPQFKHEWEFHVPKVRR